MPEELKNEQNFKLKVNNYLTIKKKEAYQKLPSLLKSICNTKSSTSLEPSPLQEKATS
jgi:hypothetical protein